MRILFLDDDLERHQLFRIHYGDFCQCTYVHSYDEAVAALQNNPAFAEAWLDHDLSDAAAIGKPKPGEKTGTHVAEFIASMPDKTKPLKIIIHSFNPVGARRMHRILGQVYDQPDSLGSNRITCRPFRFP